MFFRVDSKVYRSDDILGFEITSEIIDNKHTIHYIWVLYLQSEKEILKSFNERQEAEEYLDELLELINSK